MARGNLIQIPFRLTRDHIKRLDRVAEHCGQTRQAFMQNAVLAEVAEVEERKRLKQLRVTRSSADLPSEPRTDEESPPTTSNGLGIAERLQHRPAEPVQQSPAQQGQVVVNVGSNTGGSSGDAIDRLATFVTTGNDFDRESRLRTAVTVLRSSASTEEERKVLAARLDEAIAAKSKVVASTGTSLVRAARLGFDKLAGLLK